MKLREIEIAGFRGFRNRVSIPLGEGFTVITGRNGSGKTTVCDAIEFVLTGKLRRFVSSQREKRERGDITEKGERIEDYLWWRGKGPAPAKNLRLAFLDEQGKVIAREYEPGTSKPDHLEFLYEADQTPPDPLELICQTAILRDEHITTLSTDLRETERFEFVNAAIGVSELVAIERRAGAIVAQCAEEMKRLETSYQTYRDDVARLTSEITEVKGAARMPAEVSLESLLKDVSARLGVEARETSGVLNLLRTNIISFRREIERLEKLHINVEQYASLLSKAKQLADQTRIAEENLRLAEAKLQEVARARSEADDRLRKALEAAPIQSGLAILVEQGTRISLLDGKCPLCGSKIGQADFDAHISEIRDDIARHSSQLAVLTKSQADESIKYSVLKREFDSQSIEARRAKAELESLNQMSVRISEEAKELNVETTQESISSTLENKRNRLKDFQSHLDALEAFEAGDRLIELQHQRDDAEKLADDLAKRIEFMARVSQGARAASDTTKRISREVIENRLAAMNPLLSELYARLKPHVAYDEVKYRMRGDVLRFLRLEVGEDINPRFTFSSGQRRALGLAFLLAVYLTRPWCRLKTLVLDDPVQHVDDYRALHLAEVLGSVRQLGHQVICTVEDSALANLLCRRLRSSEAQEGLLVELGFSPEQGVTLQKATPVGPLPSRILLSA